MRNEERYIEAGIGSILRQTFTDLELIVVDDGSTDSTGEIVARIAAGDRRVRIVDAEGGGLVAALNIGMKLAGGTYIARMDADDISLPGRLARQVDELDARPSLGVLGTRVRYIDADGRPVGVWDVPVGTRLVHWTLAFGTPIAHPSVMIRREVLPEAPYETTSPHAEDYDLWVRLSQQTTLDNLPERLLDRRVHGASVSDRNLATQEASTLRVQQRAIASAIGWEPPPAQVAALAEPRSLRELLTAVLLMGRLYRASGRGVAVRRDASGRLFGAAKTLVRSHLR